MFYVENGIQKIKIVNSGIYEIKAFGAGNKEDGGVGAIMLGNFELVKNSRISILIGQNGKHRWSGKVINLYVKTNRYLVIYANRNYS